MQPSAELVSVIRGWFEAVSSGNLEYFDRHIGPRTRIIGTDPTEVVFGDEAVSFMKTEVQNLGGQIGIDVGEIEAFVDGTVGWGFARPAIAFENGTTLHPRWTGTFQNVEGRWRAALVHVSLGADNATVGFE